MMADNSIDESELKICKELALKLKIAPVVVNDIGISIFNS